MINISVDNLKLAWLEALPKISEALQINTKDFNNDGKTVSVLLALPKLFTKAKESGKVFHLYPVSQF